MSTKRIRHTAKFKFQIAVEAINYQPAGKRPPVAPEPNQPVEEAVA